jgi:hypothetical protein
MEDYWKHLSFNISCSEADANLFLETIEALAEISDIDYDPISCRLPISDELLKRCPALPLPNDFPDQWLNWSGLLDGIDDYDNLVLGVDIRYNAETNELWIHEDCGYADIHALALLIQRLLPSALPIGFEWSLDCSKPRLDAYGGGWCLITKDQIRFENTGCQLHAAMLEATAQAQAETEADASGCETQPKDCSANQYAVSWHIDVDARSPLEAADAAVAAMKDIHSTATIYHVTDASGKRLDVDVAARSLAEADQGTIS